jgi:hypothetical protein
MDENRVEDHSYTTAVACVAGAADHVSLLRHSRSFPCHLLYVLPLTKHENEWGVEVTIAEEHAGLVLQSTEKR